MTNRLMVIINELKKFGKDYSKEEVHIKMLHALPKTFRAKVVSIEEACNLEQIDTTKLVGKLLTYEMQLVKDKDLKLQKEKKGITFKALLEDSDQSQDEDDDGEDEKAYYLRKYKEVSQRKSFKKPYIKKKSGKDEILCYECGNKGHIKSDCPTLKDKGKGKKKSIKHHQAHKAKTWDDDSDEDEGNSSDEKQGETANLSFMALIDSTNKVQSTTKTHDLWIDDLSFDEMCEFHEKNVKDLNSKYNDLKNDIFVLEKLVLKKNDEMEKL